MKKIICFTLLFIGTINLGKSQNAIAKIKFEEAEEAYANKNYKFALVKLKEAEDLLQSTNPKILYLKIMSQGAIFYNENNVLPDWDLIENTRKLTSQYLKNYEDLPDNSDKYKEIYYVSEYLNNNLPKNIGEYYYWKGMEHFRNENFPEAMNLLLKAANDGNADAMSTIGLMYVAGIGTFNDSSKGVEWLIKSSEAGSINGTELLGSCFRNGRGVTKNLEEAKKCYQKVNGCGNCDKILKTIEVYLFDRFKSSIDDYSRAMEAMLLCADKGDFTAMQMLSQVYDQGLFGVKPDQKKAKEWNDKAEARYKEINGEN